MVIRHNFLSACLCGQDDQFIEQISCLF